MLQSAHLTEELPTVTTAQPRSSGVYQILCIPTGKLYVGSAVDLRQRWEQHRHRLRRGNHHNIHLQNAWDKYGEARFEFSVLEFVDPSDLLRAEEARIDRTGCADRNIGFNIYETAGSEPQGILPRAWTCSSPYA